MIAAAAGSVASHAAATPSLTIRLYNSGRVPDVQLGVARETALRILRDAGTDVRIRDCGPCSERRTPTEVVVRLIPAPTLSTTLHSEAFGVTYVIKDSDRGWLATVFVDHVDSAASHVGVDAGRLLGRVMAHEVGHLLLGVGYHGAVGVMQAEWTNAMLTRPDREWRFSAPEAARMIHGIAHP
jgi:hypothetical protein